MVHMFKHFVKFFKENSSVILISIIFLFAIIYLFANYAIPKYRQYLGHFVSTVSDNTHKKPMYIYKSGDKYLIIDTKIKKIYMAKLMLDKQSWYFDILKSDIEQKIGDFIGSVQLGNKKILFYNYKETNEKTSKKTPLNFIIYDIERDSIDKNFSSIIKIPLYSFGCIYSVDINGSFIYTLYNIANKNNIIIKYNAKNNTQEKILNRNNIYICGQAENAKNNIKDLFFIPNPLNQINKIKLYQFDSRKNSFEIIESAALQNTLIKRKINYYNFLSLNQNQFLLFGYSHKTKENIIASFKISDNKIIENYTINPKEDSTFKTILGLKFGIDTSNIIPLNNKELLITGGITGRADLAWPRNEAYIYNITNKKLKRVGDMKYKHVEHSTLTIDEKRVLIYEKHLQQSGNMEIFERGKLW